MFSMLIKLKNTVVIMLSVQQTLKAHRQNVNSTYLTTSIAKAS